MNKKIILGLLLVFMISFVNARVEKECPIGNCGGGSITIEQAEEPIVTMPSGSSSKTKHENLDEYNSYQFFGTNREVKFICNGKTYYFEHHLLWDRVLDENKEQVSSAKVRLFSDNTFNWEDCSIRYEIDKWEVSLSKN